MLEIPKLFEIRDHGTCIPVMAVRQDPQNEAERWMLAKTGFGLLPIHHRQYIAVWSLADGCSVCTTDPFQHGSGPRSMPTAHQYIAKHWDALEPGQVIDVRVILGELSEVCKSDRFQDELVCGAEGGAS